MQRISKRGIRRIGALIATVMVLAIAAPAGGQPVVPACDTVPGQVFDRPIHRSLPFSPGLGEAQLARLALPYAMMTADADNRRDDSLAPFGFVRGPDSLEIFADLRDGSAAQALFNGFYSVVYFHCRERALVIVQRAVQDLDPRDWITGAVRQLGSGEDPLAVRFYDAVAALYPDYDIALAGLSAAGAATSYVGAMRGAPSVLINPARTDAAFLNSGRNQLIVIIAGDVISDPFAPQATGLSAAIQTVLGSERVLPGTILRLNPTRDWGSTSRLHQIDVVVSELEGAI